MRRKRRGIAVLTLTRSGLEQGRRLVRGLAEARLYPCRGRLKETLTRCWQDHEGLVCIMAAGIVVRGLAPLVEDKTSDPAVVVCDEGGRFAVSLLSGHLGGGNELARRVADVLGGEPVITTASDVQGLTALDLWAENLGLVPHDRKILTRVMGRLVNQGEIRIHSEYPLPDLPPGFVWAESPVSADCLVTCRTGGGSPPLRLYPPALVAGIGCNRNTPASEIGAALDECCDRHGLARVSVVRLASIDLKADEAGLLTLARERGLDLCLYDRERLNRVQGIEGSGIVYRATGAWAVAEPAAILAADDGPLLAGKMKWPNVTCALAEIRDPLAVTGRKEKNG